jgi:hypothetical protein
MRRNMASIVLRWAVFIKGRWLFHRFPGSFPGQFFKPSGSLPRR